MKKNTTIILTILLFYLNGIFAQDVPEIQQSLITKITATWCPNCGSWGWDFYEDIYADNADKALIITAHRSGDLQSDVGVDFTSNFGVNYQPFFIVNNENQNVNSTNTASKRSAIQNLVNNNYSLSPIANAGLQVTKDGNSLIVQTKTRFFQNAMGEYYLGVYVIEDGVINFQQGIGNDAVHKNVMRASMSSSSFGELIANGNIDADSEFDKEFSIQLGNWNVNNLEIATIIWKKEGNTYQFVNAHSTHEIMTVGISNIAEDNISFNVYPNVTSTTATIELQFKDGPSDIQLELFDSFGKKISTIFEGETANGTYIFELNKSSINTKGLYFIMLSLKNSISTRKLIFQ